MILSSLKYCPFFIDAYEKKIYWTAENEKKTS